MIKLLDARLGTCGQWTKGGGGDVIEAVQAERQGSQLSGASSGAQARFKNQAFFQDGPGVPKQAPDDPDESMSGGGIWEAKSKNFIFLISAMKGRPEEWRRCGEV